MTATDSQRSPNPPASRWLVLIALVLSPLALAAHQCDHHHHHDEPLERCDVCLQFDRDDDVLSEASASGNRQATQRHTLTHVDYSSPARRFSHYLTRASP